MRKIILLLCLTIFLISGAAYAGKQSKEKANKINNSAIINNIHNAQAFVDYMKMIRANGAIRVDVNPLNSEEKILVIDWLYLPIHEFSSTEEMNLLGNKVKELSEKKELFVQNLKFVEDPFDKEKILEDKIETIYNEIKKIKAMLVIISGGNSEVRKPTQ